MGFFVRLYMRVCKKMVTYLGIKRTYTRQKNARISCSRKDCKYTWEKTARISCHNFETNGPPYTTPSVVYINGLNYRHFYRLIPLRVPSTTCIRHSKPLHRHSLPQSPSFLGHVVRKRMALEAAVNGCQKISDIRSRMCKSYKYHCSCS